METSGRTAAAFDAEHSKVALQSGFDGGNCWFACMGHAWLEDDAEEYGRKKNRAPNAKKDSADCNPRRAIP
jgi:hypothetical protein